MPNSLLACADDHYLIGNVYRSHGKLAEAVEHCTKNYEIRQNQPDANGLSETDSSSSYCVATGASLYAMGWIHEVQGEPQEAMVYFKQALSLLLEQ